MSPNARGLGRGLGALIPSLGDDEGSRGGLMELATDSIQPNPLQPRLNWDQEALQELARSISEHGILQPVVVSSESDGTYRLIAGERRWRAARLAGLETVPALVKEAAPRTRLELALVENIQREDLNALEEARAYRSLLEEHGLTQESLARRIGKSRVAVANTLRLLQLPPAIQQAVAEGSISEGHARAILSANSEEAQLHLLDQVVAQHLNVRETEQRARSAETTEDRERVRSAPRSHDGDPDLEQVEDELRHALGTRVQLTRGLRGGRLIIHFYSDDQLQGLLDLIRQE